MIKLAFILIFGILFNFGGAEAKTFSTSYLSIDLPNDWDCRRDKTEWICQPTTQETARETALVITAKFNRPEETLSALEADLRKPQTVTSKNKSQITSELIWLNKIQMQNENWVEALHLNREVENFYSYYLTTVHKDLGILLNYSFDKSKTKTYEPLIAGFRNSIRLIERIQNPEPAPQVAPSSVGQVAPTAAPEAVEGQPEPAHSSNSMILYLVGLLGLIIAAIFLLKK